MDGLTVGRVVHYVLTKSDAEQIEEQHKAGNSTPHNERIPGLQYAAGNSVSAGDHCAMMIVKVWNPTNGLINGKVFLDGLDDFWATSRSYDENKTPGSWHWIEKA